MPRIQILGLPTVHVGAESETPFVVIIDQATEQTIAALDLEVEVPVMSPFEGVQRTLKRSLADQLGARTVLVFEETVELPANQVELEDGRTVALKVEADLTAFKEQVAQAAAEARRRLSDNLRETHHGGR